MGVEEDAIVQASENLLTNEGEYKRMSQAQNPYGDGNAARNIVDAIENWSSAGG